MDWPDAAFANGATGVILVVTAAGFHPSVEVIDLVPSGSHPTAATVADAVWDEAKSGHTAAGSTGEEIQSHALSSEVSAFNDLSAAQVNTEVDTALATTTYAELTAVPAATSSLADKINWTFEFLRNNLITTATSQVLKKDDTTTTLGTAIISEVARTHTRGEFS